MSQSAIQVEGAALARVLKRMKRVAAKIPRDASWRAGSGQLTIQWAGMIEDLSASDGSFSVVIKHQQMLHLARIPLPKSSITLEYRAGHFYLDNFSFPVKQLEGEASEGVPELLPIDPSSLNILLLPYCHSQAEIRRATLETALSEQQKRLRTSMEKAQKALSFIGVELSDLESWIHGYLRDKAGRT